MSFLYEKIWKQSLDISCKNNFISLCSHSNYLRWHLIKAIWAMLKEQKSQKAKLKELKYQRVCLKVFIEGCGIFKYHVFKIKISFFTFLVNYVLCLSFLEKLVILTLLYLTRYTSIFFQIFSGNQNLFLIMYL